MCRPRYWCAETAAVRSEKTFEYQDLLLVEATLLGALSASWWKAALPVKAAAVSGETFGPWPSGWGAQGSSGLMKPQYVPSSGVVAQALSADVVVVPWVVMTTVDCAGGDEVAFGVVAVDTLVVEETAAVVAGVD